MYKYHTDGKRVVVCESTFAKKKYTGKAICHRDDEFDLEVGKNYSRLRCDYKISKARLKYAKEQIACYEEMLAIYKEEYQKAKTYLKKAKEEYKMLSGQVEEIDK